MAQGHKFQDLEETGAALVDFINSSELHKLRGVKDAQQMMYDRHTETKKTVTQILMEVAQIEESAGQRLLDMQKEQKRREQECNSLEEQLRQCTAKSQITDSELQFLQKEFDNLLNNEQELETLQNEVDEDTTEVIPSSIYVAKLYYLITKIKWEYDTEPHILKGVHYGAELASPIHIDKSSQSPGEVSDHLWSFVNSEW
ncbi:kinetochore protein Spc24 [Boleophthalmus pectinirostris]|uniref:kinetochore protein Spc24 n=1 Tax=Boleophthalmus pectinirostris TaxID=150288 RepID=UPI000A1C301A|nr:kinetochore protein Spc24 [Boleophthalmus pectinirostris]XP_020793072.1 kinetochore protein Spc24 [Boleophthalmus pectinirostris]